MLSYHERFPPDALALAVHRALVDTAAEHLDPTYRAAVSREFVSAAKALDAHAAPAADGPGEGTGSAAAERWGASAGADREQQACSAVEADSGADVLDDVRCCLPSLAGRSNHTRSCLSSRLLCCAALAYATRLCSPGAGVNDGQWLQWHATCY
jgi:hypothetical protein